MKPSHEIVADGGGKLRQHRVRVKAILFSIVALCWSNFWVVALDRGVDRIVSEWRGWLCGVALLIHPALIGGAIFFWRTEKPRLLESWSPREGDPKDFHKLHGR